MSLIDWAIVIVFFGSLLCCILYLNQFNRGIVDFLAANRTAGRYMLTISQSSASFGAITLVAAFEVHYKAGFSPLFWGTMMIPVGFIISASGWVIYRYRETRALTLAQFFELRYSKRLRIFMGVIAFLAGIVNYGVCPAVTAHFFIYFCGLPAHFTLTGFPIDTFVILMIAQLSLALMITLGGGQIAVMIADFLQGQFSNVIMLSVLLFLVCYMKWSSVCEILLQAPSDASLINPFKTAEVKDFNIWYYAIVAIGAFYGTMGWQGSQGFNACARNPHEARMGGILGQWRYGLTVFLPPIAAIAALTIMHHPTFSGLAGTVHEQLSQIPDEELQKQMTVPLVLRLIFPVGLIGLFAAAMISAAASSDSSSLHSWGSIFIQDVAIPLHGKPLSPEMHMRALRFSILGVAVFAFCFSLLFRQTENILLFFAATGAIFLGGAGSVIIGGLYWKKGTTLAAWTAMLIGSSISVTGIFVRQFKPEFPFNGMQMYFFAIASAISAYVIISLFQNRDFDLDRILYRGKYHDLLPSEERSQQLPATGWGAILPGPNFNRSDRFVYWLTLSMQIFFSGGTVLITILYLFFHFSDQIWLNIWLGFVIACLAKATIATIWFLIGGAYDFKNTLHLIKTARRNFQDNGSVIPGHNRGEPIAKNQKENSCLNSGF